MNDKAEAEPKIVVNKYHQRVSYFCKRGNDKAEAEPVFNPVKLLSISTIRNSI